MKAECEKMIYDGWRSHKCSNKAKGERDGKAYCGIHDPSRGEKKDEERRQLRAEREAIRVAASIVYDLEITILDTVRNGDIEDAPALYRARRDLRAADAKLKALQDGAK